MGSKTHTHDWRGEECPKCGHVRTADDLSPHGECPRCGIIYAKYENRAHSQLYTYPAREQAPKKDSSLALKGFAALIVVFCLVTAYFVLGDKPKAVNAPNKSIENARVILLSTTWCGYCRLAKAYLDKNRIDYLELDVERSEEGRSLYNKLNGKGVPIVLIGDTRINGYGEESMRRALQKENLL